MIGAIMPTLTEMEQVVVLSASASPPASVCRLDDYPYGLNGVIIVHGTALVPPVARHRLQPLALTQKARRSTAGTERHIADTGERLLTVLDLARSAQVLPRVTAKRQARAPVAAKSLTFRAAA